MSATNNKLAKERNHKILQELVVQPGNNICADCKARNPRWASWNLGIFICVSCASIHRKIGTHVTKVKSITMDEWTKEQVDNMKNTGNVRSNAIYNPNETRHPPPPSTENSERDSEIEQYIRSKYQYKRFLDKRALAASMLGPPASANSTSTPRSAPPPPPASSSQTQRTPPQPPSVPAKKPTLPANLPSTSSSSSSSSALPSHLQQQQQRSASMPVTSVSTNTPRTQNGGVWSDMNALSQGQNASLPLQYIPPSLSTPTGLGATAMPSGATFPSFPSSPSIGTNPTGMNPFQRTTLGVNPYAPQQQPFIAQPQPDASSSLNGGIPSLLRSPSAPGFSSVSQPGQPSPLHGLAPLPPNSASPMFSGNGFLAPTPSRQMLTSSPQLLSGSPSNGLMATPTGMAGFAGSSPMGGVGGGGQFLGMTTMQMHQQQQQLLLQQQAQQLQQQQQEQQRKQAEATAAAAAAAAQQQIYLEQQQRQAQQLEAQREYQAQVQQQLEMQRQQLEQQQQQQMQQQQQQQMQQQILQQQQQQQQQQMGMGMGMNGMGGMGMVSAGMGGMGMNGMGMNGMGMNGMGTGGMGMGMGGMGGGGGFQPTSGQWGAM